MKDTLLKGASAALALGLIAPGMAFAADADHTPAVTGEDVKVTAAEGGGSKGTTAVTWVADDSQLDITVPNTIHVVAKADGELMVPTNAAITNNSVFAVHGTKYVTTDAGITLVEDVNTEDGSKDTMEMQVTATGTAMQMGPAGEHAVTAGDLNLNKESSATLGLAGKVKLANDPATVPTDAFTIEWHFQAGLAKEAALQGSIIDAEAFKAFGTDHPGIKNVVFGVEEQPGGIAVSADGKVTMALDESGETANVMVADGYEALLPADSSYLFCNAYGSVETIVGHIGSEATVENMHCTFYLCDNLKDISAFENVDVSKVTDFQSIFGNCQSLTNFEPIRNWDISGAQDVSLFFMFSGFNDASVVADWDISNIKQFTTFFQGCHSLVDVSPLAKWDMSGVTEIGGMFSWCGITDLTPLYGWDLSNVTYAAKVFGDCDNLDAAAITAFCNATGLTASTER